MPIPGNLLTTAMAVMPHKDVDRALDVAFSLDVPFWPQLPLYSYYEDMYVQASEHFPGILLDVEKRSLRFSMEKFIDELEDTLARFDEPEYFDVSDTYSVVYHRFLSLNSKEKPAIRGQLEGPISFGFNVKDQDDRPILFNDTVRPFMLEFMNLDLDVLSLDVYANGDVFISYADSIRRFLDRGGVLVWGIVPTNIEPFGNETTASLEERMIGLWNGLDKRGIDREFLLSRSMLSPATCCLVNPDREKTVEQAFQTVKELSLSLRSTLKL